MLERLFNQLEAMRNDYRVGYEIIRGAKGKTERWRVLIFGGPISYQKEFSDVMLPEAVHKAVSWVYEELGT